MSSNDTGARYGAAGCEADITRHFVSRGAVLRSRRQNIVFISVAALSCTCAVLFVLTQTRSSELLSPWLSNEAPVAANNYAWNGLKDYHAALSKGLAGDVGETPIQGSAAKEVEDDPERLLSTLGADGLAAYNEAMASASESHQDLGNLVQHYQNLDANSGTPSSVSEALENLEAAHEMWQSRHKILERLDNEIQHERARIHALEDDEQNLLRHHERAASYVGSLLTASKNIGMQLKELRAYYEEQLEKSTEQYEDAVYEHKLMTEKMKQRLVESQERADDYNSQVSKSIAQASYYDGQVEIAKAQEREMRSRASTARTEAQSSKATLGVALTKALDEKVRERQAQALQKDAELKANAVTTVTRQKSEANEDLYEAKAKLIEAEAIAKADMSAAEDAKKRVDDGKEEERRAKTRLRLMQEELHEVMDMIINEQTKAKTAEVRAALYQSRTAAAQAELEDELAKQEAMAGQVKDAVLMVEQAEGQAALAKTEATLTEQSAREAIAASKEKVVMAQRAVEESKAHTQQVKAALEEVARRRQAAIEDVVDKQASVTDAQNVLTLAQERNELAKAYAEEMGAEVDQKKADAEALLNTVRELTGAARDTAALAKEARARVPPPKPAPLFIGVPHNMPLPSV